MYPLQEVLIPSQRSGGFLSKKLPRNIIIFSRMHAEIDLEEII